MTFRDLVLFFAIGACGKSSGPDHVVSDARPFDGQQVVECICNPLTQTGCRSGAKCTWIVDETAPMPLGHIACPRDGSVPIGGACTFAAAIGDDQACPISGSDDDCVAGAYCWNGVCEQICDLQGGMPQCDANHVCVTHDGVFGPVGQPVAAGVCDPI